MQFNIIHRPIGGIDSDTDDSGINNTDYRDALNIRNATTYIGKEGSLSNLKGNVLVSYNLGGVKHKCIGSVEDKANNAIIYFLWAKNNAHKILKYNYGNRSLANPYGTIELLMTYNFGWTRNTFIQSDIVDSKLLYWIDPKPRKLNIQKASLEGKFKNWKLYVPKYFDNGGATITFTLKNMSGATIDTLVVSISAGSRALTLAGIKSLIDASTLSDYLSVELCDDCDLLITEKLANSCVLSVNEQQILIVPNNWYGNVSYSTQVSDRTFARGKYPPCYNPTAVYKKDTTKNYNFVKNRVFQFRLQYHYDDNEDSALSPISKIPQGVSCSQVAKYNYIEVNFNQQDIFNVINLTILKQVSLFVREHNEGDWRKIVTLNPCEFYEWNSGAKMLYGFYNDISTTAVPSVLANKQYDKVGIEIGASKFVKDRIVDGNIIDDYDIDQCIDMDVTAQIDDVTQKKLFKVSGNIYIYSYRMDDSEATTSSSLYLSGRSFNEPTGMELNGLILYDSSKAEDDTYKWMHYGGGHSGFGSGFDFQVNKGVIDAYDQRLPEGGFCVYAAGTDYYTISRQKEFGLVKNEYGAIDYADSAKLTAISEAFKFTNIYPNKKGGSVFELYLPEGKHVIRLASHWCSVGDKLGKGNHYDLNSNLYQKTSTNVWGTYNNAGVWQGGVREIEVTITNSDVYLGDFVVKDLTPPDDEASAPHEVKFTNICGYLVDDNGRVDPNSDTFNPVPVELSYIGATSMNDPTLGTSKYFYELDNGFTDHNGYFFIQLMEYLTDSSMEAFYLYALQVKKVVGLPLQYNTYFSPTAVGAGTGATTIRSLLATNATIIKDFESTYWEGNLSDLYNHTLLPFGYKNSTTTYFPDFLGYQPNRTYNVIMTTDTANARLKCSTLVKGNIDEVEGMTVLSTRGGLTKTDANGDYSLIVWGDMMYAFDGFDLTKTGHSSGSVNLGYSKWKQNNNRVDKVIFINNTNCDISFSSSNLSYNVTEFDANALVQSNTPPYSPTSTIGLATITATESVTSNIKGWKRGSWRYVGIRYYDEMDRSSSVLANEKTKLYIPFITEDLGSSTYKYGRAKINVIINHNAPTWAKYFQLLVTSDRYYSNYLQFRINNVTNDNDYLKLSIDNLTTYANKNRGSQLSYTFTEGDKLRLIFNREGTYYNGLYEYDIVSWEAPNTLIIAKPLIEIKSGSLIEIYSTKQITNDNIYYEIGETYAVNAGGVHSSTNITIEGGDSYWRLRKVPVNDFGYNGILPVIVEDKSISDFYSSHDQDYGRIGIEDEKYGRTHRKTIERISNPYIPNSKINGLSNNENIDDKDIGLNYGAIRKMIYVGDVLLAICDNKIVANYIGHVVAQSVQTGLLSTTSEFIGDIRPLSGEFGSQHPNSIQEFNGYAYGFDAWRGIVWRYSTNGLDDIRIKTKTIFNSYVGKDLSYVVGGYDVNYQQYLLSIAEKIKETHPYSGASSGTNLVLTYDGLNPTILVIGDYVDFLITLDDGVTFINGSGYVTNVASGNIIIDSLVSLTTYDPSNVIGVDVWFAGNKVTYGWSESKNRWESRYSYYPEQIERVNQELITWKDGGLWIHDKNALRNNFYGTQGKVGLTIVPNQDDIIKIWMAIYIQQYQANKLSNWSVPTITNQKQLSRIKNGSFKKKEEFWHSEFKRDMNSNGGASDSIINGKPLRSQNIVVVLENDYTGDMDLDTINFTIVKSDKNT